MATSLGNKLCFDCKKDGATIPLGCGQHLVCLSCLTIRGREQPATVSTCKCTEDTSKLHIFIDNSNIWIAAKSVGGLKKPFNWKEDPRIRVDYGNLLEAIANERPISKPTLYGSRPPDNDSLWKKFEYLGINVKCEDRSKCTGKEKKVDGHIVADITDLAGTCSPSTIALASGDSDPIPGIEKALKKGWKIEIYTWEHAATNDFKTLVSEKGERVSLKYLDDKFDHITSRKMDFCPEKPISQYHHSDVIVFINADESDLSEKICDKLEDITELPFQYYWHNQDTVLIKFFTRVAPSRIDSILRTIKRRSRQLRFKEEDIMTLIDWKRSYIRARSRR